jgi:hypothetical protein
MRDIEKALPAIRCTAKKRDGESCNRWALRGGTVCQVHGGMLPNVKAAAERRVEEARSAILNLVPKAVLRLDELLDAEGESSRLAAVKEVLGQAGLVIVRKQESRTEKVVHPQELALDEILEALIESRARALGVVEAEVVED